MPGGVRGRERRGGLGCGSTDMGGAGGAGVVWEMRWCGGGGG